MLILSWLNLQDTITTVTRVTTVYMVTISMSWLQTQYLMIQTVAEDVLNIRMIVEATLGSTTDATSRTHNASRICSRVDLHIHLYHNVNKNIID